jgi:hypothetical protein
MKLLMKPALTIGAGALLALYGTTAALAGPPADWSAVPTKTVTLFYPGESTYDWLRSSAHKRAYKKVLAGEACTSCHEGEEQELGETNVVASRLEPAPIEGKNPFVDLNMQVAYDDSNVYFRYQWKTQMDRAGQMHDYMRYDGEKWAFYGGPRSEEAVANGEEPPLYEDRLTMMFDDGSVPMFAEQGCWLTCHTNMRDVGDQPSRADIAANPVLGADGLKQHDIRKYLPGTRTDEMATWNATKTADEIAAMKEAGQFVDLMQWRAARSAPVGMADDGYVLEYRLFDDGKKMFSWNVDKKTMTPKFMFDASKVGVNAITTADIGDPSKPYAIIKQTNAVPYDPAVGFKEGDILPGRLLSTAVEGSAGDNNNVQSEWKDGMYTVVWTRPMNTGHPADDKIFEEGKSYTLGLAIHDDNVTTRFHFTGFPLSIGFGTDADYEATKVE